jgi:type IV pilus biogenesis protein PilP
MALLLLGFVGVFGWSFLGENGRGTVALDGNNTPEAAENISESSEVESPLPAVEGTAISAAPDTSEVTDLPPELQYEPEAPADNTAESAPETPDTSDTSGATVDISSAERYAASGIWQEAPQTPAAPQTTALDDLYIASIDPSVSAFDAVALPDANRVRSDITPPAQSLPAAAGTTFSFDQRGLVTATAEGALTPDGILIFAGPPPLRPRNLPERTSPAATTTGAISPEELSRRAKVRPKARPEGLIEENERSQLGGRTRNELADLRPKLRPENLAATVALANAGAANNLDLLNSASQPLVDLSGETRDAINDAVASSVGATSLKPKLRPKNLDTSVATGTQVASAARSQPQLPSSASVARQATVKNQLNLRKVNLIGVTGKSGARKALVRMKNGRVKTVSVGDRLDGGRVKAIDKDALHYTRSGRTVVLKMPKG